MDDVLVSFVRESLARGRARTEVADVLHRAGWARNQVGDVLGAFADLDFVIPVPRPRPYLSARDAFIYLVLFSTLYTSAFHVGSLLFDLINIAIPDPLMDPRRAAYARAGMRWSVATLVAVFPVFLYVSWLVGRETADDPAKRQSKVRRWLTYLTLFVAACVLMGDAIVLVYNLLGGELTLRFALKAAAAALIAGGVFAFYLRDLRGVERAASA